MQDGFHTDKPADNDRVHPSGESGSGTVHHSALRGDGAVLPVNGNAVGEGGRGNSCASARSDRAADSGAIRHGTPGFAHKPRVNDVEKRDPVLQLRHGSLSVSLTSSESDSEERGRAYRWGQTYPSLRFALRFAQERCEHTPPEGMEDKWSGPGKVAHVMVLGNTHPRNHLMRAWTKEHPKGIYLRNTEGSNGDGANKTNPNTPKAGESFTPFQQNGIGQQARGHSPVIIRAGTGTGEVPSAGTLGGIPFTPGVSAPKRRCAGTSTLGGPRVLAEGGTSILQPDARTLSEDPPCHPSVGVGGRVPYIKIVLILNVGMWVGLLSYSGNHVCS
jgi:hypothetical protein